jgi:hypothetical protein
VQARAGLERGERDCLFCEEADETHEHFVLHCPALATTRRSCEDRIIRSLKAHEDRATSELVRGRLRGGALLALMAGADARRVLRLRSVKISASRAMVVTTVAMRQLRRLWQARERLLQQHAANG